MACRRAAEGKRGLSRTYIGFRNLRLVLLAQLTALRDEQLTLRDDCSLLLFNIPLDLFFFWHFSIAFKTFTLVPGKLFSFQLTINQAYFGSSLGSHFVSFASPPFYCSLPCSLSGSHLHKPCMYTHAPCGSWLDLGSFYFAS